MTIEKDCVTKQVQVANQTKPNTRNLFFRPSNISTSTVAGASYPQQARWNGFQARGNRRRTLRGNNKATSINDIVIAIFLALKERKSSSLPCFNWKRTRIEGCFQSCKVCKRNSCDPTAPVEVRTQKLETGLHSQLGSGVASSHVYRTCLKFWPALLGAPWHALAVRCAQDLSHPFLAKTLRSHVHDEFPVDQTGIHQIKVMPPSQQLWRWRGPHNNNKNTNKNNNCFGMDETHSCYERQGGSPFSCPEQAYCHSILWPWTYITDPCFCYITGSQSTQSEHDESQKEGKGVPSLKLT